jgi:hypothetical protein
LNLIEQYSQEPTGRDEEPDAGGIQVPLIELLRAMLKDQPPAPLTPIMTDADSQYSDTTFALRRSLIRLCTDAFYFVVVHLQPGQKLMSAMDKQQGNSKFAHANTLPASSSTPDRAIGRDFLQHSTVDPRRF